MNSSTTNPLALSSSSSFRPTDSTTTLRMDLTSGDHLLTQQSMTMSSPATTALPPVMTRLTILSAK